MCTTTSEVKRGHFTGFIYTELHHRICDLINYLSFYQIHTAEMAGYCAWCLVILCQLLIPRSAFNFFATASNLPLHFAINMLQNGPVQSMV